MGINGLHMVQLLGYLIISIALLLFVLWKLDIRAWQLKVRDVKDRLGDLEKKKRDIQKDLTRHDNRLSLLNKEAEKIAEMFERQGNQTKERILSLSVEAAETLESKARENIRQVLEKERQNLKSEIVENAHAMIEKGAGIVAEENHRNIPRNDNKKKAVVS